MPSKRINSSFNSAKLITNDLINTDYLVEENRRNAETETLTKKKEASENILKQNLNLSQRTSEEEFERISRTLTDYKVIFNYF